MSAFDPSKIRKAVEEFTPRRPEKFQDLLAAKDFIIELRLKRASYRSIADLLTRHCLPTCKTSVALFCHKILGETVRPYKRPAHRTAEPEMPSSDAPLATEANPLTETNGNATRSRGPRIAQIRILKPQPQGT